MDVTDGNNIITDGMATPNQDSNVLWTPTGMFQLGLIDLETWPRGQVRRELQCKLFKNDASKRILGEPLCQGRL
jgi:hypothetical protein